MKSVHPIDPLQFIFFELGNIPEDYQENPMRAGFFEIVWLINTEAETEDYMYLIPLYRLSKLNLENKKGCLIAFKRDYLEEDDKEYALDVFNLFNMNGQYTGFRVSPGMRETLQNIRRLLEKEYTHPMGTYLIIKALLKVFLLNLIRMNQDYFLNQELNQKRVYQFILLMDENYKTERKADFYSSKMGISEKRINQILKEKMNRTLTQLLHERLVVEANRMLIGGEFTIKEIAFDLNFEDPAYFSRFYKKHTGRTPEDFKKHHLT
ncbi:helix-turn-helix domain-containing protein [Chryseobacterium sp.]|uniref:helix-turn-helix domain-containing protein n=1 Tax=Chryseobacterium sp. TaxID=1871047 RepID=UPI0025BBE9D4|nr:helix-turn-helix domain-containing protein [Chryseobacterium sp.]MBV8327757.1 helix-turn-helix domain-containing protein [Chryseobacterium sp.]